MAPKDYFTLGVAILALVVSLIGVSRTWRVSVATFRNVSRNNYMNALFDLNRQAIAQAKASLAVLRYQGPLLRIKAIPAVG